MIDIANAAPLSPADSVTLSCKRGVSRLWSRIALAAVLALSVFMNFFQLGQNGYGNLYYAAAVRSMGDNWHNFFFVSFDPGGFVTVDKPPLGFWLQTLSTKIFGFTPFSIFLPQALCGVLAVLLLYSLVRRHFGVLAGLIAALALAVSPISVVTDRNNTIDGTLALVLLLAAWAVIYACETGKLRWLLLSGVFVGLGFNIKMAEAYLVLPALTMAYLLCAPRKIWIRILHLLLAVLVMLAISASWAVAVDLTPASQRPYVGSTQDNSELSLAFGYNGLNRIKIGGNSYEGRRPRAGSSNRATQTNGSRPALGAGASGASQQTVTGKTSEATNPQPSPFQAGNNAANAMGQFQGGPFGTGAVGPFRLFSVSLGGQIAWLLPFALLAIVALACERRFNFQKDRQQLGLALWGFWLVTMATFFTLDASFHQYYMTEMAPGLCALVGIGMVVMWKQYRSRGWRGWLLPIALLVTASAQIYMLMSYPSWSQWLSPLIGILTALVVITLVFLRLKPRLSLSQSAVRVAGAAVSAGLLALLVSPTVWAGYSVAYNTESSFPTAGPTAQGNNLGGFANALGSFSMGNRMGMGSIGGRNGLVEGLLEDFSGFLGGSVQSDPALISYLEAHQGNAKFLVATPNANTADSIIISTNKPVMAMGGFMGSDPILTTSDLQTLIKNGTVRFFLVNSQGSTQRLENLFLGHNSDASGEFGEFGEILGQNSLSTWVTGHCRAVPTSAWQSSMSNSHAGLAANQLYDCASIH